MIKQLAIVLFLILFTTLTTAHNVEITEDVGGTLHIEPNDTPKAGESTVAWFALTRKGGKVIPLSQCNCQLEVYSEPRSQAASPLLSPPLKSISAEQYQDIPSADIIFPKPGAYQLQLRGTPTAEAQFKPFQLRFPVIVATGKALPIATPQDTHSAEQWQIPVIAVAAILGLGIFYRGWQRRK